MFAIKGRTVKLHENTVVGKDPFGKDVIEESLTDVENVLVEMADYSEIVTEMQMTGKRLACILHIPKGDTHNWKDTKVEVMGNTFSTYGDVLEYPEELVPGACPWNKKVKAEKYE